MDNIKSECQTVSVAPKQSEQSHCQNKNGANPTPSSRPRRSLHSGMTPRATDHGMTHGQRRGQGRSRQQQQASNRSKCTGGGLINSHQCHHGLTLQSQTRTGARRRCLSENDEKNNTNDTIDKTLSSSSLSSHPTSDSLPISTVSSSPASPSQSSERTLLSNYLSSGYSSSSFHQSSTMWDTPMKSQEIHDVIGTSQSYSPKSLTGNLTLVNKNIPQQKLPSSPVKSFSVPPTTSLSTLPTTTILYNVSYDENTTNTRDKNSTQNNTGSDEHLDLPVNEQRRRSYSDIILTDNSRSIEEALDNNRRHAFGSYVAPGITKTNITYNEIGSLLTDNESDNILNSKDQIMGQTQTIHSGSNEGEISSVKRFEEEMLFNSGLSNSNQCSPVHENSLRGHPFIIQQEEDCDSFKHGARDKSNNISNDRSHEVEHNVNKDVTIRHSNGVSSPKHTSKMYTKERLVVDIPDLEKAFKIDSDNSKSILESSSVDHVSSEPLSEEQPLSLARLAWDDSKKTTDSIEIGSTKCSYWNHNQNTDKNTENSQNVVKGDVSRKHCANIERRATLAAVGLLPSFPNTQISGLTSPTKDVDHKRAPHPLVKAKSSWRIHAARARESVASLINFVKFKDKEGCSYTDTHESRCNVQPVGKSIPRNNSSPCLMGECKTSTASDEDYRYSSSVDVLCDESPECSAPSELGYSNCNETSVDVVCDESTECTAQLELGYSNSHDVVFKKSHQSKTKSEPDRKSTNFPSHVLCEDSPEKYRKSELEASSSLDILWRESYESKGNSKSETVNSSDMLCKESSESEYSNSDNLCKESPVFKTKSESETSSSEVNGNTCDMENSPQSTYLGQAKDGNEYSQTTDNLTIRDAENGSIFEDKNIDDKRILFEAGDKIELNNFHENFDDDDDDNSVNGANNNNNGSGENSREQLSSPSTLKTLKAAKKSLKVRKPDNSENELMDLASTNNNNIRWSNNSCSSHVEKTSDISEGVLTKEKCADEINDQKNNNMTGSVRLNLMTSFNNENPSTVEVASGDRTVIDNKQNEDLDKENHVCQEQELVLEEFQSKKNKVKNSKSKLLRRQGSIASEASVRSSRSEGGRRENSRRVQHLLNNQLFKKHLSKHADMLERKVFGMHNRNLKKSLSNFDLNSSQSAYIGRMVHTLVQSDDESDNENSEDNSHYQYQVDSDDNEINEEVNIFSKLKEDSVKQPRRGLSRCKSWYSSCGDMTTRQNYDIPTTASIKKSNPDLKMHADQFLIDNTNTERDGSNLKQDKAGRVDPIVLDSGNNSRSPTSELNSVTASNSRPRRVHIPSFNEYKQRRQAGTNKCNNDDVIDDALPVNSNEMYTIDETENETKQDAKNNNPTNEPSIRKDKKTNDKISDHFNNKKSKNQKQAQNSPSKRTTTPAVFSHPAIVVTTEDYVDFGVNDRINRRQLSHKNKYKGNQSTLCYADDDNIDDGNKGEDGIVEGSVPTGRKSRQRRQQEPASVEKKFTSITSPPPTQPPVQKEENSKHITESDCLNSRQEKGPGFNFHNAEEHFSSQYHHAQERCNYFDEVYNSPSDYRSLSPANVFGTVSPCSSGTSSPSHSPSPFITTKHFFASQNRASSSETTEFDPTSVTQRDRNGEFVESDFSRSSCSHENSSKIDYIPKYHVRHKPNDGDRDEMIVDDSDPRHRNCGSKQIGKKEANGNREIGGGGQGGITVSDPRDQKLYAPQIGSVDELELSDAAAEIDDDDKARENTPCYDGCTARLDDVINKSSDTPSTQRGSPVSSASDSDNSNKASVLRSTSDVSSMSSDDKERRKRERRERPYKSDPFTGTNVWKSNQHLSPDTHTTFRDSLSVSTSCSFPSLEELAEQSDSNSGYEEDGEDESRKRFNRLSTASSASEDSGVVSALGGRERKNDLQCQHCVAFSSNTCSSDPPIVNSSSNRLLAVDQLSSSSNQSLASIPVCAMCNKCVLRRRERKETIQEIAETEKRYGKDLAVLKDEFYRPLRATSLLTPDQLDAIFLNLDDLINAHKKFMERLTNALVKAVREGDEGLSSVAVGNVFVGSSTMLMAFENYCVHQAESSTILEQMEKDKELLKLFLQVAQNENPKLRRMHLKSFLMSPVQRVMKYPLLLGRLYKTTPCYHGDKNNVKKAREQIEEILEQINSKTHTPSRPKNRQQNVSTYSVSEKIEVNRVALEVLGWRKKETSDVLTSRLWFGQVPDITWASKRARNVKFSMVHAALLSLGRSKDDSSGTSRKQVALVLVRDKGGKFTLAREPFFMDRCVVTVDSAYDHVFELHEQGKDTYLFKADYIKQTKVWSHQLQELSKRLGYWRRRRNGLANILLKTS